MKPFEMISGTVSPKSIGLAEAKQTLRLVTHARRQLIIPNIIVPFVPLFSFTLSFYPLAKNSTTMQLLLYVIPWSIIYSFASYSMILTTVWQLIYFNIICYYLRYGYETLRLTSLGCKHLEA
jgi:ABC-type multidrug transport system permease subunit